FDVAYIGMQPQPLYRFGIAPNKLMDYMMAERPVLMSIDSGNDPVAEAECGLTVQPGNPKMVVEGIRYLMALSAEERKLMGKQGRTYVLTNHIYSSLAQKFIQVLN
ncbi:MAG: hypothetical protein WCJ95_22480, partial [Mariniphaga sp.]